MSIHYLRYTYTFISFVELFEIGDNSPNFLLTQNNVIKGQDDAV